MFLYNQCMGPPVSSEIEEKKLETIRYPVSGYSKDADNLHLYVRNIRILTPGEYKRLRDAIPKLRYKTILDIMQITGMRYIELIRLYHHKEWYNESRNLIHLPEQAQKKVKRRQLERTIYPLPSMFHYLLRDFWGGGELPNQTTMNKNLQRWAKIAGLSSYGISVKTTRKTLESWMISAGIIESTVCLRQGHSNLVSMRHYQGLVFSDDELKDIKKLLKEWNLLR
jgi:integrase